MDYFKNVQHRKRFAFLPAKERTNIFNEGNWIWLKYYFEWHTPQGKFKERCNNFLVSKG
jgi:hypothetical protein